MECFDLDLGPFASIIGKWNDLSQHGKMYTVRIERNRLQVVIMDPKRFGPSVVNLQYRPNPPELLWGNGGRNSFSLKPDDFSLEEIRWRFHPSGRPANHWRRSTVVPTPPAVPPPLPRARPVKRSRSRSPRGEGLAQPVDTHDDAEIEHNDADPYGADLPDDADHADDEDHADDADHAQVDHVDDQAHDDDDLAHPAYDADPAETDEADASHLEEHADDADADHNMVNTHGKDMKEIQIDVLTCGLRDLKECEEEATFIVDMRSFYDPGCGPLKKHDGGHDEIIRRMVHHHLFTDLVKDLRMQLAEHLQDSWSVKFLLYCKSGRHRSVAAGNILHYILLSEGYSSTELHHVSLGDGCGCDKCKKPSAQRCLACEEGLRKWRSED